MFLVCGEALYDVFIAGATAEGLALDARIGGSPWNVAKGLARLGQPAALFAGLSRDALGDRLAASVREEGVAETALRRKPLLTTLALVGLGPDGAARYSFYNEGSADRALTRADLPSLEGVRGVHVGSYSLVTEPTGSTLLDLARAARGRALVSLDPNLRLAIAPDLALWRDRIAAFRAAAHLVKASDEDLAALHPGRDPEETAAGWAAEGAALVVVTKGAAGAVAFGKGAPVRVAAPAVAVADTVGAGDTFQAALLAGLAELGRASAAGLAALTAEETRRLLGFAAAAAAITCTRRGADLPRRAELPRVAEFA